MEILPCEIQRNMFKFMRHPMAEVFLNAEQVKEAIQLANENANFNYWSGGELEQERWRVGFVQRVLL